MGLFDKIRRAMGFDPVDDDDLEEEGIDATVTPLRQRHAAGSRDSESEAETPAQPATGGPDVTESMRGSSEDSAEGVALDKGRIFGRVVEVFNDALPSFLKDSVDPDRQKQHLYALLDEDIKGYFDQQERRVERRLQQRFEGDRRRLQKQIEDMQQKAAKDDENASNAKNAQLSAERQKRALTERVHELEKQLTTIQAENEQFILENKAMANKLRMAALSDRDIDEYGKDLQEREEQLSQRQEELDAKAKDDARKLAQYEARLAEAEASRDEAKAKLAEAEALTTELQSKLADAEDAKSLAIAQAVAVAAETRGGSNDDAILEAQIKNEELQGVVDSLQGKLDTMQGKLDDLNTKLVDSEKEKASASESLAVAESKLQKAMADLKVVAEVKEVVAQLEERQRVSDASVLQLKDQLMEKDELLKTKESDLLEKNTALRMKDESIRRLEDQTDSLRRTIETLSFERTQSESALRGEIDRLKSLRGVAVNGVAESVAPEYEPVSDKIESDTLSVDEQAGDLELDLPALKIEAMADDVVTNKPRRGRPPKKRYASTDINVVSASQSNGKEATKSSADKQEEKKEGDFAILDTADWLIAEPTETPAQKRQRKAKQVASDDFGYKEPPRQDPPDSPAQMSLW